MNAVTLTVVAMLYSATTGEILLEEIVNDYPGMTSCLEAAANDFRSP